MRSGIFLLLLCWTAPFSNAAEVSAEHVRSAVGKLVPWLERATAGATAHNKCFTCHNHALPVIALAEAQRRNFVVDGDNLTAQLEHTAAHLERGRQDYLKGKGQGGRVLTAGFALWTLDAGEVPPNDTTAVVAGYLVREQNKSDHWVKAGRRPPSEGSEFTATYVALRGLRHFAPEAEIASSVARFVAADRWLTEALPRDTEDAVFRLKSLALVNAGRRRLDSAVQDLLGQQNADGGWSQKVDMSSDAYATGTVLATLLQEGELPRDHVAVVSAAEYLLSTQLDDGTWHVVTRADGFQPYYESGFPHGEDQFLSVAASSWAALALLHCLPRENVVPAESAAD